MDKDLFHNKDGSLTKYAFACGYVEKKENKYRWKKMQMEFNTYHVMSGLIVNGHHTKFDIWEVFESDKFTKAKNYYNSIRVRDYKRNNLNSDRIETVLST